MKDRGDVGRNVGALAGLAQDTNDPRPTEVEQVVPLPIELLAPLRKAQGVIYELVMAYGECVDFRQNCDRIRANLAKNWSDEQSQPEGRFWEDLRDDLFRTGLAELRRALEKLAPADAADSAAITIEALVSDMRSIEELADEGRSSDPQADINRARLIKAQLRHAERTLDDLASEIRARAQETVTEVRSALSSIFSKIDTKAARPPQELNVARGVRHGAGIVQTSKRETSRRTHE